VVDTTARQSLGAVDGLGDLSHAHAVYSRDGRYAYVFGRDGGLTKVDLLTRRIDQRVVQAGNSIGGSISQDGRYVVAQNYDPGGVKVFDAATLELVADVPAVYGDEGRRSKVVVSRTCRATASPLPCTTPARSGSWTSRTRGILR